MQLCFDDTKHVLVILNLKSCSRTCCKIMREHIVHLQTGSCLDVASPTRGRIMVAFNCSLSARRTLLLGRKSV